MKSEIVIKVFVLKSPACGDWWEFLKVDGSTRTFRPGTAEYLPYKTFKNADVALKYGNKHYKRFMVIQQDPPVPPSRTWEQTTLHDVTNQ